jgi:hypothetical protein
MKISSLVVSLADARIGVPEAGAGRGLDTKLAESHQSIRILLIRKVYRFLRLVAHIMPRPNQLVGLSGEAERLFREPQQRDHHLWNNLLTMDCQTIEFNN